jgi:hypothetical protein
MRLDLKLIAVHEENDQRVAKLLLSGHESLNQDQIHAMIDWLQNVASHLRNPEVHSRPGDRSYDDGFC